MPSWRRSLALAVASVGELLEILELEPGAVDADLAARLDFPLRVPRAFVERMRKGDPADPLLLQVLPRRAELEPVTGYVADPLQETAEGIASPVPGLLRKFRGRALLVVTGACAVHCRYCFRRHFPYPDHRSPGWRAALEALAEERSITEVILSGGDPLAVSDDRLGELVDALARIPHLRRLRIHTRLPVVVPERVDGALLAWLGGSRFAGSTVVVVHVNHARELDGAVAAACDRLRRSGVTLLNQAVLLAGINDRVDRLRELSEALFDAGVLPYYLHLLDPVAGAAHFDVDAGTARRLVRDLAAELPGYLVPRLVREVPGAPAKLPVEPPAPGCTAPPPAV